MASALFIVGCSKDDNDDNARVCIKRCQIIRQERNPQTKKYECAMEFKEIVEEETELTEEEKILAEASPEEIKEATKEVLSNFFNSLFEKN